MTFTATTTVTQTATQTFAQQSTPTVTPTATVQTEAWEYYPNPINPSIQDLNIAANYDSAMDDVKLDIYTESLRKVREIDFGAVTAGNTTLQVKGGQLAGLTRGAYYVVVNGVKHGGGNTRSGIKTLLLLY